MADRHTIHVDGEGALLRRHRTRYWPTTLDADGLPDDGEEWQRGACIDVGPDYGWTIELVVALLADVLERRAARDHALAAIAGQDGAQGARREVGAEPGDNDNRED